MHPPRLQMILASLALVLLVLPGEASAKTVTVPGDHSTLKQALEDTTLTHGDTILVGPGTWSGPGNRNLEYHGKDLVLKSTDGPLHTIIDVEGSQENNDRRGFLFARGQFGTTSRAAVLEGFTIRNGWLGDPVEPDKAGKADWRGDDRIQHDLSGAGIMFRNEASATVRNCIIENCYSEYTGGGIGVEFLSAPLIEDVIVRGCVADIEGGGITVETVATGEFVRCVITGNEAPLGGGISAKENTTITDCVIAGNRATRGGGLDTSWPASYTITNTIIWGNCATDSGAQIMVDPAIPRDGGFLRISCSAVDTTGVDDLGGVIEWMQDNVFTDPQFCEPISCDQAPTEAGQYTLREGSPCLPNGNACNQLIGPNPNACSTLVEKRSISQVKSLFR